MRDIRYIGEAPKSARQGNDFLGDIVEAVREQIIEDGTHETPLGAGERRGSWLTRRWAGAPILARLTAETSSVKIHSSNWFSRSDKVLDHIELSEALGIVETVRSSHGGFIELEGGLNIGLNIRNGESGPSVTSVADIESGFEVVVFDREFQALPRA